MTIKEEIVRRAQAAGFDFISACEIATKVLVEFRTSGKSRESFVVGRGGKAQYFELRKNL